jgi:hypothetical protein
MDKLLTLSPHSKLKLFIQRHLPCNYSLYVCCRLVQELMRIRERLEFITPLMEPRLQSSARRDNTPSQNCPPLVLKSPQLMQVFGLPSDLASSLYRLETAVPQMPVSATESTCVKSTDL